MGKYVFECVKNLANFSQACLAYYILSWPILMKPYLYGMWWSLAGMATENLVSRSTETLSLCISVLLTTDCLWFSRIRNLPRFHLYGCRCITSWLRACRQGAETPEQTKPTPRRLSTAPRLMQTLQLSFLCVIAKTEAKNQVVHSSSSAPLIVRWDLALLKQLKVWQFTPTKLIHKFIDYLNYI